jgi:hypothetical protein
VWHPKPSLAVSKPRFTWRNYIRTLNNPRAIEDRPQKCKSPRRNSLSGITVLIASALINASTVAGLAAESTLNKDVNAARAVSATVHNKPANGADNEKICRAYAASLLRQAAADRVDGAWVLTALDSVINIFNDLLAPKCGG